MAAEEEEAEAAAATLRAGTPTGAAARRLPCRAGARRSQASMMLAWKSMRLSKGPSKTHELLSTVAGEASQSIGAPSASARLTEVDNFFFLLSGRRRKHQKQAGKMRTKWVTKKQTADGFLGRSRSGAVSFLKAPAPDSAFGGYGDV